MLDFASALYLGFDHATRELLPWTQFTTGKPAALGVPEVAPRIAAGLAAIQGCDQATLGPSTLHLFWDLFGVLAVDRPTIFLDVGTYPVARWGVERAVARGAQLVKFRHHAADALRAAFKAQGAVRLRPLVVTDGFCPGCGRPAPLSEYLEIAREGNGLLIIDDTQALGIFGESPSPQAPFGRGGGGMLRYKQINDPHILLACSLAKAFGVPLAALAGHKRLVQRFEERSESRTHSSPPSIATLHAAERALQRNGKEGDAVRLRLAQRIQHFRRRTMEIGLALAPSPFPVQTLAPAPQLDPVGLYSSLQRDGIRAVLHRAHLDGTPRLSFLITAKHTIDQLDRAARALFRNTTPATSFRFATR